MIVTLVALGFAAVVATILLRGHRGARNGVAAAAVLGVGLGGYVLTGRPGLPAAPPAAIRPDMAAASSFEAERQARLPRFGRSGAWLTFADALLRADAGAMAVRGLRGAIDADPGAAELWIGLGHALAVHGGRVGAASRLAFARAAALDPASPQPAFFLGLAQLDSGDARGAGATWRALKRRSLPDAGLDRWLAVAERQAAGQP